MADAVSIGAVLEKLEGNTISRRDDGLEDLRRIFGNARGNPKLDSLGDAGFLKILESLFNITRAEKSKYLNAATKTAKSSSESKLSAFSAAFRVVADAAITRVKHKTSIGILDHVIETLSVKNAGLFSPLRNDYMKVFRSIMQSPSLREHLKPQQWESIADFLLEALDFRSVEEDSQSNGTNSRDTSVDPRSESRTSTRVSQASRGRIRRSDASSHIEELVVSLKLLTSTSNTTLAAFASRIVDSCLNYLDSTTKYQESALEILNNVFPGVLSTDMALARSTVHRCIPILRRSWSSRSGGLKDQILCFLMNAKDLFCAFTSEDIPQIETAHVQGLFDTLSLEYGRKPEKDSLQVDDVYFPTDTTSLPLCTQQMAPVRDSTRAVTNWTCVAMLAGLLSTLHRRYQLSAIPDDTSTAPGKRRKIEGPLEELIRQMRTSAPQERLYAIQTLFFAFEECEDVAIVIAHNAMDIATGLSSENDSVANWTMLLMSRFASTAAARSSNLQLLWAHCCNLATRNLSSQGLTRAACHLFDSILLAEVVQGKLECDAVLEALFANGSQGPCMLTDTALSLWQNVLTFRMLKSPEAFHSLALKAIGWLNTCWTLPQVLDRLQNASMARYSREDHMYSLLVACMGASTILRERDFSIVSSPIYARCAYTTESAPVSSYLLHQAQVGYKPPMTAPIAVPLNIPHDVYARQSLEHAICELLLTKLKTFREARNTLQQERSASVSIDIMQILCSASMIASSITITAHNSKSALCEEVATLAKTVWNETCSIISSSEADFRQRCLLMLSSSLLRIEPQPVDERNLLKTQHHTLAEPVLEALKQSLIQVPSQNDIEDDLMDFQASFPTQNSQGPGEPDTHQAVRQKISFATDVHSAVVQMTCRVLINELEGRFSEHGDTRVATAVVDFASGLSPANLVASRQPLAEFFQRSSTIMRSDATRLLECLAANCLEEVEFERCESALCFCVDVLSALAHLWTVAGEENLDEMACDMYGWYLDTVIGKGIATEQVMLAIARMLTIVSASNSGFGSGQSLPSPRTSLLRLLKAGTHVVQYNIADLVCQIFEGFVLGEHWAIFDDVLASLPSDPEQVEGIAIRLHILGKLACRWHTLLRKAVYSIFETAAHVQAAIPFAQKSYEDISYALSLSGPRKLFIIFSPQILYTWLEKESLDTIPYNAFKYKDLRSMLIVVHDEVVGQIAMRTSTAHASDLSRLTGTGWDQMLCQAFPQSEAYCVARDISTPRDDDQSKASEAMLRKEIGNDVYLRLIQAKFPQILARLFTIMSDDHGLEKALSKRKSLSAAQIALTDICKRSQSTIGLPKGQQPSFRSKYIFDEIDYLCKRVDRDPNTIWEPTLVVYVCRELFDLALPALGPLHSCAIIRKIRTVVCLAGPEALRGYPLEMLLHTLKQFLADFHCSEDALGLFWYLLDHGKSCLESRVSFVASLAVSTFATISSFLGSSQDSTTQESHFISTMTKVQTFRDWLVKYLQVFRSDSVSPEKSVTFSAIMRLASSITEQGGSTKGSPKGDLLYVLLQDQESCDSLLTRTAFVQAMEALCVNFTVPADVREDILYVDEEAARAAPILLTLLDKIKASEFVVWVAHAIGRAYASSGDARIAKQKELLAGLPVMVGDGSAHGQSHAIIVKSLTTILRKDDRQVSGMAERALQRIFTGLTAQERSSYFGSPVDKHLLDDMTWTQSLCPSPICEPEDIRPIHQPLAVLHERSFQTWACDLAIALCSKDESDFVLIAMPTVLTAVPSLARDILAPIAHIVLLTESNGGQSIREDLSKVINEILGDWKNPSSAEHIRLALRIILYLRHQPMPRESTMADRNLWLEVKLADAAAAASSFGMPTVALLFFELSISQQALPSTRSSRKSSIAQTEPDHDLMKQIFYSLEDPDFFFGVQEEPSLQSLVVRIAHGDSAHKNLSFQSALFDSECRTSSSDGSSLSGSDIVGALSRNNLNGIARAVQLRTQSLSSTSGSGLLQVSMNLSQWDLSHQAEKPSSADPVLNCFKALESFSSEVGFFDCLDTGLKALLQPIVHEKLSAHSLQSNLGAIAILTESRELLSATSFESLKGEMENQTTRARWEAQESFDLVSPILLGREATINTIRRSQALRTHAKISLHEAQFLEVTTVRNSLKIGRSYSAAQFSLNRATYLSKLAETPAFSSQKVAAAILHDTAHVLWDQGEASASTRMLRQLTDREDLQQQAIVLSKAEILADLGQQMAEARLSKPDAIIGEYLLPAIRALRGVFAGQEAGRVFHNFAVFCDMQLQNAEDQEEFARVEGMRQSKLDELNGLEEMIRTADPKRRENLKKHKDSAKKWFNLDDDEYQRLRQIRERFIAQSLENYLRSMGASDSYANDTLRFVALWLDQSGSENAQAAVERYLTSVSSLKFAPLMNQLSSRILDSGDPFQRLLTSLLYRVCCDHPHHSLYQLFAASKSKGAKNDVVANSRHSAAGRLADRVMKQSPSGNLWVALHNCSIAFVRLANEKLTEQKIKSGSKIPLRNIENGRKLEQTVHDLSTKIPPPTMKVALRADRDYSSTPTILKFNPEVAIASGVSAPKIITILATDSSRHKMLLKGGNDDLRQDSIMEQVFEQVSNLLKDHRTTRRRNLGIRTYKVLPLTPNAGIIEFVKDTIPLHEYLLPAHQRYFPRDWKASKCRKEIADAQDGQKATRVQAYRKVCTNFQPVMRFFFMEHFLEPDDWFQRRLAFSRSVAATSILGHVLGLGDRHGHNILLDQKTGEVVHIDLGVAFEAGRILPVPELVPFRLTRDMVDGMGLSGVEGVFRRCCNFTLEALRQDQYSIMTVLDVLRYDPLYSWSMTPLRLQKMQEAQEMGRDGDNVEDRDSRRPSTRGRAVAQEEPKAKKNANEASEADRALTVVAKKLGKSLSVEATVNELIQQATDEGNLAMLYCGWAAYA